MTLSLNECELAEYLSRQVNMFFPEGRDVDIYGTVKKSLDTALFRLEYCFSRIKYKGYGEGREAVFSHLHSDQYCIFLYYLANSIWREQPEYEDICRKIIGLNKALNSVWISYKANLPKVFLVEHPVGTVLGNAAYGEYAFFLQNVTVNTQVDNDGKPVGSIGKFLFCSAGATIIGNENIGDEVTIGVDTVVFRRPIQSRTLIYRDKDGCIKEKHNHVGFARQYFYED